MKYIKFEQCEIEIDGQKIMATDASISASSRSLENRVYGGELRGQIPKFFKDQDGTTPLSDYTSDSPLDSSLNIRYYLTGKNDHLAQLTGNISCSGRFCGIEFSGAYMSSYGVRMEPFSPVLYSADLLIYSGYNKITETGNNSLPITGLANTAYSNLTNFDYGNIGMDHATSIDYYVSCERTPNYVVDREYPEDVTWGRVLKSLRVEGENIGKFITYTGEHTAELTISNKNISGSKVGDELKCKGIVTYQNLSINTRGVLAGGVEVIQSVRWA